VVNAIFSVALWLTEAVCAVCVWVLQTYVFEIDNEPSKAMKVRERATALGFPIIEVPSFLSERIGGVFSGLVVAGV
jgi:hypothetical protein